MKVVFASNTPQSYSNLIPLAEAAARRVCRLFNDALNNTQTVDNDNCVSQIVLYPSVPPTREWGSLSDEKIMKELKDLFSKSGGRYGRFLEAEGLDELIRRIREENCEAPNDPILKKARTILNRRIHTSRPAGIFKPVSKEIVLYYNVIGPSNTDGFKTVLAHELFHAYHFNLIGTIFNTNTNHAIVVEEASADYFAYFFCITEGIQNTAERLFDKWSKWLLSGDPYAKAWFYLFRDVNEHAFSNNFGELDRLERVIDLSATDMTQAYQELVPPAYQERKRKEDSLTVAPIISSSAIHGKARVISYKMIIGGNVEVCVVFEGKECVYIDVNSNHHVSITDYKGLIKSVNDLNWDAIPKPQVNSTEKIIVHVDWKDHKQSYLEFDANNPPIELYD